MTQNIQPIFPKVPSIQWPPTILTAANTAYDGTGIVATVFTADTTNGSRLDYLKVRSTGTNSATVLRVFINNGAVNTTAANNTLYMERTIPATTISAVAETADIYIPMDLSLPPGYVVNVTLGTAIGTGLRVTAIGGHY